MKAAPTPWVANRLHVDDANKEHVLTVDTGAHNALDASIAAEVVRRVNSFDALVEAHEAARAREEQREACARALDPETTLKGEWFAARVRATPLDATPLADEIRVLKATLDGAESDANIETVRALRDELAALREERDALKAALKAEADAALKAQLSEVSLRDELTALRPQLADADLFLTAKAETVRGLRAELAALDLLADAYLEDANREKLAHLVTMRRVAELEAALRGLLSRPSSKPGWSPEWDRLMESARAVISEGGQCVRCGGSG